MGRPNTAEERAAELRRGFERSLRDCEPWRAVSALAQSHWDRPDEVMAALLGCPALRVGRAELKTVGVYYSGMGTGGAERVTRDLILLWRSMGYRVVFLCNEGPADDQYALPDDVSRAALPTCFGVGPEDYPARASALSEALRAYEIDLGPADDQYALPDDVSRAALPTCFGVGPEDYPARASALSEALRAYEIDLLVYGQWLSVTLPWDMLVCKSLGVPMVIQTHGTFGVLAGYGRPEFLRLCEAYAHAGAVTCLSETDRTFWLQFNPKTFYIPNPLDQAFLSTAPAALEGRRILWVGRIAPDKNPAAMLDVLSRVRQRVPDAQLSMVGPVDPTTRANLMQKAADLGVESALLLPGNVAADAMEPVYRDASVFVMTSRYEGYPTVLAEAEAVGGVESALLLPGNVAADAMEPVYRDASVFVMTSRYEGYPTVLAEAEAVGLPTVMYDLPYLMLAQGDCGVTMVPMDDVDALAQAVGDLLLDEDARRSAGAKARENLRGCLADETFLSAAWKRVFDAAMREVPGEGGPVSLATPWYSMWKTLRDSVVDRLHALNDLEHGERALEQELEVAKGCAEWERGRALEAQERVAQLENELATVRGSLSFRVGRALTAPIRKIRDLIQR